MVEVPIFRYMIECILYIYPKIHMILVLFHPFHRKLYPSRRFYRSQDLLCLPRIGEAPNGEILGVSWLSNNHSSGEVYSFGERLPYISMTIYLHPRKTKMELENAFSPRRKTFTNHQFWWVLEFSFTDGWR